jgi:hypothetical protein
MAKAKKQFVWVLRAQVISKLRRLFSQSPMFKAVKDAAKVEIPHFNKDGSKSKAKRYMYRCKICGELFPDRKIEVTVLDPKGKKIKKKRFAIAVDHIAPVIGEKDGFIDMNTWIERCFVGVQVWDVSKPLPDLSKYLRILCWSCHDKVSAVQNQVRRDVKKAKAPIKTETQKKKSKK